ncbi:hypothetical protein [Chitinophaga filiformis]|uniref:Uncharacterized protein n=1 Tax=Chitinophaga filiformis TaxID=104663 RepID=A0ABY4I9D3_CHIFI|nr:hypothetical protein [Chitinophaga filiformis]UPK72180.1 hypothetical protein MYF79_12880 [Chitinophaga filiformis]
MTDNKSKQEEQKPVQPDTGTQQPIDEQAERYIKEPVRIEDVPTAEEQKEAEDKIKKS